MDLAPAPSPTAAHHPAVRPSTSASVEHERSGRLGGPLHGAPADVLLLALRWTCQGPR